MADPKPLTRNQISRIVGRDPEAIKAFERLFAVAGQLTPADIVSLTQLIELVQYDAGASANRAEAYQENSAVFDYVDLRRSAPHGEKERRLCWNDDDATINIGMEYGVSQQVGLETYARVENNTGVTIPNGTVVGFFGGGPGSALSVEPYLADGSQPSLYILGVMTHDLPDNGTQGYCTSWGYVRDLDTSAFSVGDMLYPSPTVAGALTNVKPTAPDNVIPIASCLVSDASAGVIFVRPTIEQMQYYGVFSKTNDQSPTVVNTAYALTFNTADISNGVAIGAPSSRIVVPAAGLYALEARVQISSASASKKDVYVWFRHNGTDIPNTTRIVTSDISGGYVTVAMTEIISLEASDYIEMAFASNSTSVTVDSVAATAFSPAAPAIILSVTQVQQ